MKVRLYVCVCALLAVFSVISACRKGGASSVPQTPVTLSAPERIVTLSPAATEIVCAAGAFNRLAARSDFCDFPPEVKTLPSAGGFDGKTISLETVLSFSPDFVYMTKGIHDHLVPLLQAQGIRTYLSDADSVQSVLDEISYIGKITGNEKTAQSVCNGILCDIEKIKLSCTGKRPSVYWEVWSQPYMSAGGKSFINELISIAGGENIFSAVEQSYPVVSEEAVIMANPEIIFISDAQKDGVLAVKSRSGWKEIDAVKNNRIYSLNADVVSRPGPRIAQATSLLHEKIYSVNAQVQVE